MLSPREDWIQWAETLRRYQAAGFASWLLDAGRPLAVLTAQVLYWGQPFLGDPRAVLIRAIEAAAEMGFTFNTGPELEFFLLRPDANGNLIPPVPQDMAGYFDVPTEYGPDIDTGTPADGYVELAVTPGADYHWVKGASETDLINGSTTISASGDFSAEGDFSDRLLAVLDYPGGKAIPLWLIGMAH